MQRDDDDDELELDEQEPDEEELARADFIERYGEDPEDVLGPNWLYQLKRRK